MRLKRDQARSVLLHAHYTIRLDQRGSQLLGNALIGMMTHAPLTSSTVTVLAEGGETVQLTALHETRACQVEVRDHEVTLFSGPTSELIRDTTGPMPKLNWGHLTRIDLLARAACSPWTTYDAHTGTLRVCDVTVLTLGPDELLAALNGTERRFDQGGVLYTSVKGHDGHLKLQVGECLVCLTTREADELDQSARSRIPLTPGTARQEGV